MVQQLKDQISKIDYHEPVQSIGTWRELYMEFIDHMSFSSICEIGAGSPAFLKKVDIAKKCAIDLDNEHEDDYNDYSIKFYKMNLDQDELHNDKILVDIVVCSDVFEHLLFPKKTLDFIHSILNKDGVLFSHVPNEFGFRNYIKIALFNYKTVIFHNSEEHENPHLRRFSKRGYLKFLEQKFKYNLFISDINFKGIAKILNKLRFKIPYGLEPGQTYISTNSDNKYQ